jgi:hypothetical protein
VSCLVGIAVPEVAAAVHNLFVANRNAPANIHSVQFDDVANTLRLVKSSKADATHIWISFSVSMASVLADGGTEA